MWEHKFEGRATLSKGEGYGTAITLTVPLDDRLYAMLGGMTASAKVRWRPAPPTPAPVAPPESSDHQRQSAAQARELATPVPSPGPAGDPAAVDDEPWSDEGST
jgi:hypothetical protein